MLKLFRYLRPYSWYVAGVLVFLFAQALAELYLPTLMSDVVNNGMMQGGTGYIWRYGSYMLFVALGSGIWAVIGSFLSSLAAMGVGRDLRNAVFTPVESYSLNEFDQVGAASLITRTTNDIVQVQTVLVMGMRFFIFAPIMCVGGMVMALRKDTALRWILAVVLPIMLMMIGGMAALIVPRAEASAVRINAVLELQPEIDDPAQPVSVTGPTGHVEFQNVTFSYAGAAEPALKNITFAAAPGEVTAIIGGTGAGKSTLINLSPRFYETGSGRVLIDGVDVRTMTQQDVRARIGFVPQTPVLFSGTIAENLRYGKADATDTEIAQAAEIAQATEFITTLPDGFNAQVAQGGANFSGGQKQRLAIARALVRRPEIYIVDDSFSALDFKTDARLRAALKKETKTATVILIAQRVSTVMEADRLPLKYFDQRTHGEILSRVTNDMDTIAATLQQSLTQLITSFVTVVGILIMMLSISPVMTLIALFTLPVSGLITAVITKNSQKFFKEQQKCLGELNGHVEEMYSGHKIVKAFGHEADSIAKFRTINQELFNVGWKAEWL